ncbi:hypothetical protein [Enterobacter cloacae complex sp. 288G10]|uniref:hypothetical protein n=1 Tax=Enterobacter cloacae complex sp. 288G10 TaxID=3395859 RepID=UPI003CEDBFC7
MTGNWVIADSRDYFEHVVLCVERPDGAYDIFTGSFIKLYPVENCKSKIVEMSNPVLVGMTYSIRKVFNGGKFSRRGIAYLSIPAVTSTKVAFPSRTYQEGQEQITMSSPDQARFSEDVRKPRRYGVFLPAFEPDKELRQRTLNPVMLVVSRM